MKNFVLIKTFKALPNLRPLIVSRNLFASTYLDSVNFQIQRRKLRHHDKNAEQSKMKIMKLYERMGVEGLYTESLQLLIHCVDPKRYDDMSLLTQILIEDCKANVRKLEETRMLLSLYFWLCYTQKDADNSKLVFDEVYKLIDSYHTKNRYFSTLLETERYQDIIEGYEKLEKPSFDDMMFCMAAFYKIGGTEEFAKAKYLYKIHSKGRLASIFALFCLNQNEIDQAVEIVNLDYCLKNNILPKEPVQCNLLLLCLIKIGQTELSLKTLEKWSNIASARNKNLKISSEIFKMLRASIESGPLKNMEISLYEPLKKQDFITNLTIEKIVFEPVDWNEKKEQNKNRTKRK